MMLLVSMLVGIVVDAAPARMTAPPLRIAYAAAATVSPSLLRRILDEADALWRPAGVTFAWEPLDLNRPVAGLQVVVEDLRAASPEAASHLGWLLFDHDMPSRMLHVSYANARALLENSGEVVGSANRMPIAERETYLGRAMGRALAHELGHYLLASKAHTLTGLMRGTLTSETLFSPIRTRLELPRTMGEMLLARLTQSSLGTENP
ncbi:MAG TPA: hypothetical protein VKH42_15475 [Vicinamibacterales bacterium]|nr:hypothetical protein [Vicinamibacterales bacterium]